jgi:hypothetical protein
MSDECEWKMSLRENHSTINETIIGRDAYSQNEVQDVSAGLAAGILRVGGPLLRHGKYLEEPGSVLHEIHCGIFVFGLWRPHGEARQRFSLLKSFH